MRQPTKPKPDQVSETLRVLHIYDWLAEEMKARILKDEWVPDRGSLLLVAERIAARTEPAA